MNTEAPRLSRTRVVTAGAILSVMMAAGCGGNTNNQSTDTLSSPDAVATLPAPAPEATPGVAPETTVTVAAPAAETEATIELAAADDDTCTNCLYMQGDSVLQGLFLYTDTLKQLKKLGWNVMHEESCGRPIVRADSDMYQSCDKDADGKKTPSYTGIGQLNQPEDAAFVAQAAKIVTVLGSNDWGRSANAIAADAIAYDQKVKSLNPNIEPYWVNTYLDADPVEPFEQINSGIAQSGENVIDFAAKAAESATTAQPFYDPEFEYGLHPNREGYEAMEKLVLDAVGSPKA